MNVWGGSSVGEHTAEDRGVEGSIPSRPIMDKYDGLVKYDKLIRDRVPEIISNSGAKYKTHIANDDEYWEKLRTKLSEKVEEFLKDPSVDELADIVEIVHAIADFKFGGSGNVNDVKMVKFRERGGFEKRLILDETDNR